MSVDLSLRLHTKPLVESTITVAFPIDTVANARTALERVKLVVTGALATLDAGFVAEYGEAETLRGLGQLLSVLSRSIL